VLVNDAQKLEFPFLFPLLLARPRLNECKTLSLPGERMVNTGH